MDLIQVNEQNIKYFSEDFIKGFNTGASRQYQHDTAEKTGRWLYYLDNGQTRCKCSECLTSYGCLDTPYCPNCGARMEGENE